MVIQFVSHEGVRQFSQIWLECPGYHSRVTVIQGSFKCETVGVQASPQSPNFRCSWRRFRVQVKNIIIFKKKIPPATLKSPSSSIPRTSRVQTHTSRGYAIFLLFTLRCSSSDSPKTGLWVLLPAQMSNYLNKFYYTICLINKIILQGCAFKVLSAISNLLLTSYLNYWNMFVMPKIAFFFKCNRLPLPVNSIFVLKCFWL